MSRIEELEQRISEMLAADAGAAEVFFPIIDLVKEYEDTFNSAIEIRRDNLAYVIIAGQADGAGTESRGAAGGGCDLGGEV